MESILNMRLELNDIIFGKLFATTINNENLMDEIAISKDGKRCLICLQEYYPLFWTSMDNGTFYCDKHKEILRSNWEYQCNQN